MIRVTGIFFFFILANFVRFLASSVSPYWVLLQIPNRPNFGWTLPFTISFIIYFPTSLAAYVLSVSIALPAPSRQPLRWHVFQQFLKAYRCSDLLWDVTRWFICITNRERKGTMSAHILKVTSTYITSTFIYNILGKLFKTILLEKHRQDCPHVWWLMSDIWCSMSDVRCLMTDFWCLTSDVSFQMSDVRCHFSDVGCLMSSVWCLMTDTQYVVSDVQCLMFDFCCLMSDVRCLMTDMTRTSEMRHRWHQTSDIEHRTSNIKHPTPDIGHQTSDIRINGRCREVAVSGGSTVGRKTVLLGFDYCFLGVSLQNYGFVKVRDV